MALPIGSRLGPYEVQSALGAGGMGEVYRARDTRLDRDVAIKVLPDTFTSDEDRLARFQREAKVLASLNHPNIATIHGIEDWSGSHALVMELVDGPTLADRITQGPLAITEALAIARQIVGALASAHACGIVHRDLKPANVKLRPDGLVKVLDFGLAKAIEPANARSSDLGDSPTITSPAMTRAGVILGTAAYMSPEQARGQRVDAQTDVWAFGCVLYEMLTGRSAFGRATVTDTMAAVIEREPEWTALPRETPDSVVRLLRRTLEKDPRRRLHALADALLDLDEARNTTGARPARASSVPSRRMLVLATAAAGVIVLLLVANFFWRAHDGSPPGTLAASRLSVDATGLIMPQLSVVVSPDGRRLVYVSTDNAGGSRLWVRDLSALAPTALAGTEDAAHPFWKPDGSAIGFVASGKLKIVHADGGQVQTLANEAVRSGASWSSTGVILFKRRGSEFNTVPDTGGPVSIALETDDSSGWPCFLPDGRHFIFHARDANAERGVYVGELGAKTITRLFANELGAVFAAPDYLVFGRPDGLVFAQRFDLTRLRMIGEPFPVAEGVWESLAAARVSMSAAADVLAYINASVSTSRLVWVDRSGQPQGTVGEIGPFAAQSPRLSPDGASVALSHGNLGASAGNGIWVTRLADGDSRRLISEPSAGRPLWSSDSLRVLFQWTRGPNDVVVSIQDAAGSRAATVAASIGGVIWDWSPDGRQVVLGRGRPMDVWIQSLAGGDATPFARSAFNKTQAQISPDGRWIAYTALDTGRDEVYVDSFPVARNPQQVSVGGGMQPRWRRDGTELFYLATNQMMMTMSVTTKDGPFEHGRPTQLFPARLQTIGSQIPGIAAFYDVTRDGQRFLLNEPPAAGPPITVVFNWAAGLTRRR